MSIELMLNQAEQGRKKVKKIGVYRVVVFG